MPMATERRRRALSSWGVRVTRSSLISEPSEEAEAVDSRLADQDEIQGEEVEDREGEEALRRQHLRIGVRHPEGLPGEPQEVGAKQDRGGTVDRPGKAEREGQDAE